MDWIKHQLAQPSTARGLALAGSAVVALGLNPDVLSSGVSVANHLWAVVSLVVGVWDIVRRGRVWGQPGA